MEYKRLILKGYSLITADKNKRPLNAWKEAQTQASSIKDFDVTYTNMSDGDVVGIVTGHNDLECMDVDLKVFSTQEERDEWFTEYVDFLDANIENFNEKFVIYKTKNNGYHILYKTKRVEGNLKVAKLKGHKQQVLETRGTGGYVVVYTESYNNTRYEDIDYISDEDRDILFTISRSYNYIEPAPVVNYELSNASYSVSGGLTPWEDFNNKTNTLDLLVNDFDIVGDLKDRVVIKRKGAKSQTSGQVYKDSDLLYLYTTGTDFDAQTPYNASAVYAVLNHNGDFSASAKDLRSQGYGDSLDITESTEEEPMIETDFPLEIFPEELQMYIKSCAKTLNHSIDYMACSLLFVTSTIIGNSLRLKVKNGYYQSASVWLALVGKAGVGKTPSINSITFPLEKLNSFEIKKYIEESKKYEAYASLNEKDRALTSVVDKPIKGQLLVEDATLEALAELHEHNSNGIGLLKDELAGFFKSMNQYREGGDKEHWLSSWSGKPINLNRKTAKSSFIEKAFLPFIGGVQPSILDKFYEGENSENGFIDRVLFSFPNVEAQKWTRDEMSQALLDWYENFITGFYQSTRRNINYNDDGSINPITAKLSDKAYDKYVAYDDEIVELQNGEDFSEDMKSMLPKQAGYTLRFSLILNTLASLTSKSSVSKDLIEEESVVNAIKLSRYFINNRLRLVSEKKSRGSGDFKYNTALSSFENYKILRRKTSKLKRPVEAKLIGVEQATISYYRSKLGITKK